MWSTLEYTDPHQTPIDPPTDLENCQRMGIMATFENFEDFEIYFSDLMNFFQLPDHGELEGEMSPQELSGSIKLGSSFKDFMGETKVIVSYITQKRLCFPLLLCLAYGLETTHAMISLDRVQRSKTFSHNIPYLTQAIFWT